MIETIDPNATKYKRRLAEALGSSKYDSLAPSNPTIEAAVWKIWEYVRENCDSLDSARCTARIRQMVDAATEDLRRQLAEMDAKRKRSLKMTRTIKARVKKLESRS